MALTSTVEEIIQRNVNGLLGKHPSWERVRLGDVATIQNGAPFDSAYFNTDDEGMPLLRIRDVGSDRTQAHYTGPYDDEFIVRTGDLVIGMDGEFNCALWQGDPALLNQRVCRVLFQSSLVDPRFVFFALPGYLAAVNEATPSVTVKHLSSKTVADLLLPLPPREEQQRIVERLSLLEAEVGDAQSTLDESLVLLAEMEQACLSRAFAGGEPHLLDALASIQSGITKGPAKDGQIHEVPYLRTANVQAGYLDLGAVKTIAASPEQVTKHALQDGDVLVIEGGDADKVGRGWIWRGEIDYPCLHQNHVFALRPRDDRLVPEYLAYYINSPDARTFFAASAKQTTNLASINKAQLKKLPIPLRSEKEQREVVKSIESALASISELRSVVLQGLREAAALSVSVRRAAFSGALVDPEGNGGAAALARQIETERKARNEASQQARKARNQRARLTVR